MLEDGSMDASFTTHTEGLSENVGTMELTQTQLVFCVSANHPLAEGIYIVVASILFTIFGYVL